MVKIITSTKSHEDLEEKVNEFINSIPATKFDVTFSVTPMHDLFYNRTPEVCNQWIDYTAVIIY